MKLRPLPPSLDLGCFRVYVRVDWNIPLGAGLGAEESLKLARSYPLLEDLRKRGAIVFILTHFGRPKGREAQYSTKPLAKIVSAHSGLPIQFQDVDVSNDKGRRAYTLALDKYEPGDLVLLENVRFQPGEETNSATLVHTYADHADAFVNDAFASCHRAHASVIGLAHALPSFAGPALLEETSALSKLFAKPKKPYLAIVGGAKLSTKMPIVQALLKVADKVMIGGAMTHPFLVAKKMQIGKSLLEKEGIPLARKLLTHPKLLLPTDLLVAKKVATGVRPKSIGLNEVGKTDIIVDIGTQTMRAWAKEIKQAKTIVWNGPVGITEIPAFSHGSLVLGKAIASRAKGKAYGVAGGGDTLPVVMRTGMQEWFDFISTGGGAMLEYLSEEGVLPGLTALEGAQKKTLPKPPHSRKEYGVSCAPLAAPVRRPANVRARKRKKC